MSWLTAKVMQYIALALLALCVTLGMRGCSLSHKLEVAGTAAVAAASQRDAAVTERDAWKGKAEGAVAANAAYGVVLDKIRAQQEADAAAAAAAASKAAQQVAAAQAAERKAEASNAEYRRLFGNRPKDCDAALQALDRVCPLLRDY